VIDQGFIKVHRSILSWEWYQDINTKTLFLHLLLTVNWEPGNWRGITIERGQRVCSLPVLSKETGLSVQSVRTALNHLKSTGEITDVSTSEYRTITIKNYESYQMLTDKSTDDQQTINRRPTDDQQLLKKNKKARKQEEKEYISDSAFFSFSNGDEELLNALNDFSEMRIKTKSALTDRAKELLVLKLKTLGNGRDEWIAILNQSTMNNWKGVFALKDKGGGQDGIAGNKKETGGDSKPDRKLPGVIYL